MAKSKATLPLKSTKPVPVKIVSESIGPMKDNAEQERKWRAENDVRTMQLAEEIKKDKERFVRKNYD